MKILALQLKRIGDLVLTTPALVLLRSAFPAADIALAVAPDCAPLLAAIPSINTGIVLGSGRGFAPWQQVLTGPWQMCLDFTGTDRSALATALSRARVRVSFEWVRKNRARALAYNRLVSSSVRERHTEDHYADLVEEVIRSGSAHSSDMSRPPVSAESGRGDSSRLALPPAASAEAARLAGIQPFAVLHPGSARVEKFWVPERWVELITHLRARHGLESVLTGGGDERERAHLAKIQSALEPPALDLAGKCSLLTFAALLAQARLCVSCDTAAMHFAAAFRTRQVALFGPTNPFHWRPRHEHAAVLSATQPDAPLTRFEPRLRGAPMERISTAAVLRATDALLAGSGS